MEISGRLFHLGRFSPQMPFTWYHRIPQARFTVVFPFLTMIGSRCCLVSLQWCSCRVLCQTAWKVAWSVACFQHRVKHHPFEAVSFCGRSLQTLKKRLAIVWILVEAVKFAIAIGTIHWGRKSVGGVMFKFCLAVVLSFSWSSIAGAPKVEQTSTESTQLAPSLFQFQFDLDLCSGREEPLWRCPLLNSSYSVIYLLFIIWTEIYEKLYIWTEFKYFPEKNINKVKLTTESLLKA